MIEFQSAAGADGTTVWRTTAGDEDGRRDATWEGLRTDAVADWMEEGLRAVGARPVPSHDPPERTAEVPPPEPAAAIDAGGRIVDGEGYRGARLVPVGAPWSVDLWWQVAGGSLRGPGEWRVDVVLSPIGRSAPLDVPPAVLAAPEDDDGGRHEHRISVPPGLVGTAHCAAPYRAVVTLTYGRDAAEPPALATALDLGLIRFYDRSRARAAAAG